MGRRWAWFVRSQNQVHGGETTRSRMGLQAPRNTAEHARRRERSEALNARTHVRNHVRSREGTSLD